MKRLALFLPILTLGAAYAQPALNYSSLYISHPLNWERGHRPGQPTPKYALGTILAFEPNGLVAAISCFLYRTSDNQLHIMYQEGFSLTSGTWAKGDGHFTVRLRSIHSSVRRLDQAREEYREESWEYAPPREKSRVADWVKIKDVRFVPLTGHLAGLKELAQTIQFYRTETEKN